jgi:hypothetical protein
MYHDDLPLVSSVAQQVNEKQGLLTSYLSVHLHEK